MTPTLPEALARVERLRDESLANARRVNWRKYSIPTALGSQKIAAALTLLLAEAHHAQRLREALTDAQAKMGEISRLRLATDEGSLRVRADRMWEVARLEVARLAALLETP